MSKELLPHHHKSWPKQLTYQSPTNNQQSGELIYKIFGL